MAPADEPTVTAADDDGGVRLLPIEPERERTRRRKPPRRSTSLPYEPALDGLRGLAVAGVVLYHLDRAGHDLPWAVGGYLGVDAFFVLSGFLITSLLLVEWLDTDTIDLREFWSRRARRLLPALFLVLGAVAAYAYFGAQRAELDSIRWDGISTLFYVANWRFIADQASYFDTFITESPLAHMWSLAIEEQWYLFWPLVVFGVLRWRRSLKAVLGVSFALMAASAVWMAVVFEPGHDPSRVYFGTDTRAQSLLVGAILGTALIRGINVGEFTARRLVPMVGLTSLVGLLLVWATVPDTAEWIYRGGFLLLAIAVALVILASVQPEGNLVRSILSFEPLRLLGLISYGVYLWHWPIFTALRPSTIENATGLEITGAALLTLRLVATLGVSIASYVLVERPIRRGWLRDRISFSPVLVPAMAVVLLVVMLASTRGAFDPNEFVAADAPEDRPLPTLEDLRGDLDPETRPAPDADDTAEEDFARVLIVGDSVANTLAEGFTRELQADEELLVWNQTVLFCQLLDGSRYENGEWVDKDNTCDDWEGLWKGAIDDWHPDVSVLGVGAWEIFDRRIDGDDYLFGTDEFDEIFTETLDDAIETLASGGGKVVLLTTPRFERQDDVSASVWTTNDRWRTDHLNELFAQAAEAHPDDVVLIDLGEFICPNEDACIQRLDDGTPVRYDGLHFSDDGATVVAEWLTPELLAAAESAGDDRTQ